MTKHIAIVTAQGIGDGLIMQIAAHNLHLQGYLTTTYNDHLPCFGPWFQHGRFAPQSQAISLSSYDAIFLQHDNTPKASNVRQFAKKCQIPIYTFFGSHNEKKHGVASEKDFICNPEKTMVDNLQEAISLFFQCKALKENGLTPPHHLTHKKYPRRIAIHPESTSPGKNWSLEKFHLVAKQLKNKGFDPVFLIENQRPLFPSLSTLSAFLYESGFFLGNDSGPGHLASCLKIPSLIIGNSAKHMQLWRPGWLEPTVITPPKWTSYFKWTRKHWKSFIFSRTVIRRCLSN